MSSLLAVKLRRDLRATWTRIVLMATAIAVGLTAFGAVLFAWSAIDRETRNAYLTTEPASATIRFAPGVDAEEMAEIAAEAATRPGVLQATGRTQFTSDVEVDGQEQDNPMQVFVAAPDDALRMAKFFTQQGSWPPSAGEVFLRGDSRALLGVAVGDTVTVETPNGEPARLRVAGTVYDPSLAAGSQHETAQGYLSTAALAALGETDVLDQLKIQVAEPGQTAPSRDRAEVVAVAGDVGEWLEREHGLVVREVQVPEPYAHPHQGQTDTLLGTLLVGAGAALLLSTILVATMLNNVFAQQIPQIGIMKAIGAGAGRIGGLYLAMTLVVAGAATLVAVPMALVIGRVLAPGVLGLVGVEPTGLGAAWWTYPVLLAAGLLLPVSMVLLPLVKTSRTTVRAAIDHHGGGSNPSRAAAVLTRLRRLDHLLDRGLLMALRNTVRRPARFALSVSLLAVAGMVFIAVLSARAGAAAVAEDVNDLLRWDVEVQLADPTSVDTLTPVITRVPGVDRVEGWTTASASVTGPGRLPLSRTYPDQGHGRVAMTAIPAGTTMQAPPDLLEGRWLQPGETGAIVLSQITVAATDLDVRPGDTVELSIGGESTTWRVVGIVQERGETGRAYVTAEGLAKATGSPLWSTTLRIATDRHDEPTRQAVTRAVTTNLTRAGIQVNSAESVGTQEAATGGHLAPILAVLLGTALPTAVIGLIGLASTMSANILDRTREFGVMHAIGARPKSVRRIVVAEGVGIALASCLLALPPTLGLTAAMGSVLGNLFSSAPLPFRISGPTIGIWTALVVLGAILATNTAATRASRITVREALAYL